MSIAPVQLVARGVRLTSATTLTLTPSVTTTAGNMLFVAANATAAITSVSDSQGNTYHLGPSPGNPHSNAQSAWTFQDVAHLTTSDTITVTWAASGFNRAATVYEFSNVAVSSAADTSGTNNTASNTATVTTSGSITNANSILLGVTAWDDNTTSDTFSAGSGYTLADSIAEAGNSNYGVALQYRVLSGAALTTYSAAGSISNTGVGHSSRVLLAFSPAANSTTVNLLTATATADAVPLDITTSSTGITPIGLFATGVDTSSAVTQTLTPGSVAQNGSLLVLAADAQSGHTLVQVTDTKSNTWTIGPNPGSSAAQSLTAWTVQNSGTLTPSDVITLTFNTSSSNKVALIFEFAGQDLAPLDASGTSITTSPTGTVTTSSAITNGDDLLVGVFAWAKNAGPQYSFAAGAGYTLGGQTLENDTNMFAGVALEYQVLSGASLTTKTAGGTISGSPTASSRTLLAFRPVSSAVTVALPTATASADAVVLAIGTGGWTDIGGATGSSYTPVSGDVGFLLRAQVVGANSAGSATEFTVATSAVSGTAVAPTTGAPTLDTQTAVYNHTINALANDTTWNGTKPLTYTYQWQHSGDGVTWTNATGTGATTSAYLIASADVGTQLRCAVTGTNSGGAFTADTPPSLTVTLAPVAPGGGQPALSDQSPTVGQTESAIVNEGTWTGTQPITYTFQWQNSPTGLSSWSNAPGAGSGTANYVVDPADQGMFLRVLVTGTNVAGSRTVPTSASDIVTGALTDLVLVVAPVISFVNNPPRVGDLVSSTSGTWTGSAPISFVYEWQHSSDGSNWLDASGAGQANPTYTVDQTDLGLELRCLVSATNPTGSSSAGSNVTNSVILGNTVFTSELIVLKTSTTPPITAESSIVINLASIGPPGSAADSIVVTLDTTPPIVIGGQGSAAGRPNYLRFCGVEIANQARVISYVQNGLAGPLFDVGTGGFCPQLLTDAGRTAFIDPQADAAPWFDVHRPESRDFLGFLCTDLEILASVESVSATNILGNPGGAVFGPRRRSGRFIYATGSLVSASPEGLDYGFQWLKSALQSSYCDDCATCFADVRITCPPLDGSDNQRGFWRLLEVALVDGPKISQTYDYDCAYLVDIEFTLEAAKPYLYKLPQVCVQPQELLQDDGSTNCIAFDQWLCGAPTAAPICCQINPPLVGTIATQVVIETQLGVGGVLIASYASPTPVATDVPVSQMVIPYLPPGSTLVLDSGTHEAVFIAANGSQTDGQPYIGLPVGQTLGWVEVAHCDPAHSICISPLHPCSGGIGTFVSVSTIYRED